MDDAMQKKIDMAMRNDMVQRSVANNPHFQREKTNLLSSAAKYAVQTPMAIGAGAGNFIGETVDFVGDVGIFAGNLAANAVAHGLGIEDQMTLDDAATAQAQQNALRGLTSFLKSDDAEGEPYYNTVKNITESGLRFATIWGSLGKAGLGNVAKATISGAGEGLINDPESQEFFDLSLKGLRSGIGAMSPESLEDFDTIMNPEADSFLARQAIRRVTNAMDGAMVAYGGEKVIAAGGAAIRAIPDNVRVAARGLIDKTLKNARLLVEKAAGKMPTSGNLSAKMEIAAGVADDVIELVPDAFDPKLTAKENIKGMLSIKTDSTGAFADAAHYQSKLDAYQKKLADLAPQIQDKVVSMAKVRGVEAREALRDFAKELGVSETELLKKQGLQNTLRAQAHNILVEQEGIKFQLAAKHFQEGAIDEGAYMKQFQSFFVAQSQRAEALTGGGRVLRTSQEISAAGKGMLDVFNLTEEKLRGVVDLFENSIGDKEQMKFLADKMSESLNIKAYLDVDDDVFTAAIIKAADGAKDVKAIGEKLPGLLGHFKNFEETFGRMTQANLLTGTTTLVQNSLGTLSQQGSLISEAYIRAGLFGTGSAQFREANALLSGTVHGYIKAAVNMVKAVPQKQGKGGLIPYSTKYRQLMADIPAFDKSQARVMMNLDKAELQGFTNSVNPMYDAINKTFARRALSGGWSFDAISLQDSAAKGAFAYGKMKQLLARGVYSDDLFGIQDGVVNLDTAKKLAGKMLASGDMRIDGNDLKALGVTGEKALDVLARVETWRKGATEQAFDEATSAVFQNELGGGLAAARKLLQEKIPFGRAVVPFFTTPVRILDESLKRMPMIPIGDGGLGLPIHPQIYKQLKAGGTQREDAISKIMFGNIVALFGQRLAEGGYYQPVAPNNDLNAYLSESYGRMPGSLLINGKSYSTSFLGPIHNLFGIGATRLHQFDIYSRVQQDDPEVEDLYIRTLQYNTMNLASLIMEQPFATGADQIAELFGMLETDFTDEAQKRNVSDRLVRFIGTKIGNVAPSSSLQRQISNNMMDYQRRADGMAEHVLSQFSPYLLENKAYDAYGNPVEPPKGFLARYKNMKESTLEDKLYDENAFVPERRRFNYSYTQPSTNGTRNPVAVVNLAEQGVWNEFNERKADGMFASLSQVRDSLEYTENLKSGRIDLNRKLLQARIREKEKQAFESILLEKPGLYDVLARKQQESIHAGQKGKGFITKQKPNVPTFILGEEQ